MKYINLLDLIGNTPNLRLKRLFPDLEVWMKLEKWNPGGSIKDRIAFAMIQDAEKKGILNPKTPIVEPTSGNTGIGLALCAAIKGYELILTMPESMSPERRKQMKAYGATIVLTPKEEGMKGAINKAYKIKQERNAWMPMQFENDSNSKAHYQNTAQEIISDFPKRIDYLVAGVGTGGHISGIAKALKEKWPDVKIIAVEPAESAVLSNKIAGPHLIQGIGAGFIPQILNQELIDDVIPVSGKKAYEQTRKLAKHEGLLAGISTGAAIAAIKSMNDILKGKRILTFNYDTGERYLSVNGLFD